MAGAQPIDPDLAPEVFLAIGQRMIGNLTPVMPNLMPAAGLAGCSRPLVSTAPPEREEAGDLARSSLLCA